MHRSDAFAGAGLGLLVGVLVGLSSSSVVGSVVAALAAGLGAFLGLTKTDAPDRALRIGTFGLICVVGILLGLTIRSGAWLAPSVRSEVASWTTAGFEPAEARHLVAFQRLGVRPPGREVATAPAGGGNLNSLFSDRTSLCSRIARLPDLEIIRVLGEERETAVRALSAAFSAVAADARPAVIRAGVEALCF